MTACWPAETRTVSYTHLLDEKVEQALEDSDNEELLRKLESAREQLNPEERGLIGLFYNEEHTGRV